MKKLFFLIAMSLFLASCGQSMVQSEFLQHRTMYKDWDHMKFSIFGYTNPTAKDAQESAQQDWWGIDVPYVPGQ